MATYTVQSGDCLWAIARDQLGDSSRWPEIANLNNLGSPYLIYPGNVLTLPDGGGGSSDSPSALARPVISFFGILAPEETDGGNFSLFAVWQWDRDNTDTYDVVWYYDVGNGIWFVGSNSSNSASAEGATQSIYSIPSNAKRVKFRVKPISKTYTVNDTQTTYWTADWSTEEVYNTSSNPPTTPSVPTVSIAKYLLTATLSNLDVNAPTIQYQIVQNDSTIFNTAMVGIVTGSSTYVCNVNAGATYKVRCRAVRDGVYSEWSAYSSNASTIPGAPLGITVCKATSETAIYLEWVAVPSATSYDIEYTTKKEYFDGSDQTSVISGIEQLHYQKTGMESGKEYLFRIRAVNSNGVSSWSGITSLIIGKPPAAPTTWSSTTTGITGEQVTLYWVHNSEDNSTQTYADVELTINGVKETYTINSTTEVDDKKTMHYVISTSAYTEGTSIQWRIRTAGVTKTYGDWSVSRTIDIYAPPTLTIAVKNSSNQTITTVSSFPMYISAIAGPTTQKPLGYHISITSKSAYETVDALGTPIIVKIGDEVYSKNFDTSSDLLLEITASNIDLQNNIDYKVICTVAMNSGLTAVATCEFTVRWTEQEVVPNAEIGIDETTLSAVIRPFCADASGALLSGITLGVYRREFDGTFTELATGLPNTKSTYVTDPHPALDLARYRVVAITVATGAVGYYDIPGYPVGENSVILQWDERWSNFESSTADALEEPAWSGSMLKIPYDIDVSDNYSGDTAMAKYVGRKNPVCYYGTQNGHTATWSMVIPKSDKATLYGFRRLAVWMGDVYVREPSGSGYWANVTVAYSQKHCELTIPISLSIVRVEGGE